MAAIYKNILKLESFSFETNIKFGMINDHCFLKICERCYLLKKHVFMTESFK